MTQLELKFPTTEILTFPACLASALINGDTSGLYPTDFDVLRRVRAELGDLEVVDILRDENGEPQEPWFTWNYRLYGGDCSGGECLEYVCVSR